MEKTQNNEESPSVNHPKRFFSNPIYGKITSFTTIIGVVLSVYFYKAQQKAPDLTCYVHPVRATLVRTGETSRLTVQLDGKEVQSEVSAMQVALWNRGSLPIRASDVLTPVTIEVPGTRILEATVRKQSREVVNTKLLTSSIPDGVLGVEWDILEKGDGGIVQIIYEGSSTAPVKLRGVIVGQPDLSQIKYGGKLREPEDQIKHDRKQIFFWGWFFIISSILIIEILALCDIEYCVFIQRPSTIRIISRIVYYILMIIVFFAGLLLLIQTRHIGPPFGF